MKIRFYFAALGFTALGFATLASMVCVAGDKKPASQSSAYNYITSEKIRIKVTTDDVDPKTWLRMYYPTIKHNIPLFIEFDVENVKLVSLTDEHAGTGNCDRNYPKNLFYLLSKTPMKSSRIKTYIGKPCLINRSAKMKLRVISTQKDYLERIYNFTIDPISGAQ